VAQEEPTAEQVPNDRPSTANGPALDSPQATMFTFLAAANDALVGRGDLWPTVLATLDTSQVQSDQDVQQLAARLKDVLDRLRGVRADELFDAGDVRREGVSRFKYFPRGQQHSWVWEQLGKAPDGEIWLEADAQGVWRFSAQTVAGADRLWQSMRDLPPAYDPAPMGQIFTIVGPTFERTRWWEWLTLLGAIFVGLLAGKATQMGLRATGDRLEARQWAVRSAVFRSAASPANLALITVGLFLGLTFIYMEKPVWLFFLRVLKFLALLSVGWFLYNLVDVVELLVLGMTRRRFTKLDQMVLPLIRKTLRIFLVIVFTLVVAQNVFEVNITGWLAGLGIAGLAVSLAAQDSIKNLFGSLTIFFDRPFYVGDFITFDSTTGKVEEIGFRSTRIRIAAGHLITVPNMKFIDGKVENISKRPAIRREMNVTITYDTPPDKVEQAVQIVRDVLHDPEVVAEGQFDMENSPPRVSFNEFNADSLNIKAFYWYQINKNPDRGFFTQMAHAHIVNIKLLRAFEEAGIEFAFPTQTLYLAGDPKRKLAVEMVREQEK